MPGQRITNVCFHGIGAPGRPLEPGEEAYWVSVDGYRAILDVLAGRPDVRISLDDGNWSDVAHALPALLARGLTATFFVVTGRLGRPGSLDEDAVRHLAHSGMRIGTHGMRHRSWRRLDATSAHLELVEARSRLADLVGGPVDQAALPLGQYDRTTLSRLHRLGYRRVFTSDRTKAVADAWLQARYSVRATDGPDGVEHGMLAPESVGHRLERSATVLAKRLR